MSNEPLSRWTVVVSRADVNHCIVEFHLILLQNAAVDHADSTDSVVGLLLGHESLEYVERIQVQFQTV